MLKVYVTPITPNFVFEKFFKNKAVLISYLTPQNYVKAVEINCKIYFDNGAFTFYMNEEKRKKHNFNNDYENFYNFLENKIFEHFFIPDIINGTEKANNILIQQVPSYLKSKAIPVFHLHESLERLEFIISNWSYIALGSSQEYWKIGNLSWFIRMNEIMKILCDKDGKPKVKIHMLRCLNKDIFTKFPFFSGDSSNFARNHKRDTPEVILNRIEPYNSPVKFSPQLSIYDFLS